MKLKNILLVVNNIEESKRFYKELFDLQIIRDNEDKVILMEGLVLQDRKIWERFVTNDIINYHNACELYFEETNIESFIQKLDRLYPEIEYVNKLTTHSWGKKFIRFYDLDGNIIEVGTPD